MSKYIPIIQKSILFQGLSLEDIHYFLSQCPSVKRYLKGSFIGIQGDPLPGMGLVLSGELNLIQETLRGDSSIIRTLLPPDIFGEAILFTPSPTWPVSVQAIKDSEIIFLPRTIFTSKDPALTPIINQLLIHLLSDISHKVRSLTRKIQYLSTRGMRERILAYVSDLYIAQGATIHIPHSREAMAQVLHVSRPSMCRELSRMHKEGLIHLKGRTLILSSQLEKEWQHTL